MKIMNKYTVEKGCGSLTWIHVTEPNEKGETLLIELSECTNPGGKMPFRYYGRSTALLIEF